MTLRDKLALLFAATAAFFAIAGLIWSSFFWFLIAFTFVFVAAAIVISAYETNKESDDNSN